MQKTTLVDLAGIEPALRPCKGRTLPLCYRPEYLVRRRGCVAEPDRGWPCGLMPPRAAGCRTGQWSGGWAGRARTPCRCSSRRASCREATKALPAPSALPRHDGEAGAEPADSCSHAALKSSSSLIPCRRPSRHRTIIRFFGTKVKPRVYSLIRANKRMEWGQSEKNPSPQAVPSL